MKGFGRYFELVTLAVGMMSVIIMGCGRGLPFEKPPAHVDRGMSEQPKFKPQSENDFFADKSSMRMPVSGTVAQEEPRDTIEYFTGEDSAGNYIAKAPIEVTMQALKRGQERFNIYCTPCHSRLGDGRGIMITRGYPPPPSYHTDRLRNIEDGSIFDAISNGVRNMPAYGPQVPVADRWDIVLYLRALQRSQNAMIKDIPEEMRQNIK